MKLNLEVNQIVDPSIEVLLRDNKQEDWQCRQLYAIDHRCGYPYKTKGNNYKHAKLIEKTYLTQDEILKFIKGVLSPILVRFKGGKWNGPSGYSFTLPIKNYQYTLLTIKDQSITMSEPKEFIKDELD